MIHIKRVYDPLEMSDGVRVLVDRLWPRGVAKDRAAIQQWSKDLAPSTELRKWFGHDPAKWKKFQIRYRAELQAKTGELEQLRRLSNDHTVTLVYGAKDELHNHAIVLKQVLDRE